MFSAVDKVAVWIWPAARQTDRVLFSRWSAARQGMPSARQRHFAVREN